MSNEKIVTSLKVKDLFSKYDVEISFGKLTVLVGKNGLGKTTLLKIIHELISGEYKTDYASICETIDLRLRDDKSVIFGKFGEDLKEYFTDKKTIEHMVNDASVYNKLNKIFDEETAKNFSKKEKKEIMKAALFDFLKTDLVWSNTSELLNSVDKESKKIFLEKEYLKKLNKETNIRYISTVNISANASNNIDVGNSVELNILDLAIHQELRTLLRNEDSLAVDAFLTQLNMFLQESGKKAELDHNDCVFITVSGSLLNLSQLSSGERQLVYILATAANTCGKPTLFLMDEPEVSLHLSWQEKIIDAIMHINSQMQIIAVTHSPGIIMNGHMDAYVEMKDIMQEHKNV